jgi:hypothetical protein
MIKPNFFMLFLIICLKRLYQPLKENPEQFINQLVLITYQELPNQDGQGTFYKVKGLEIV